MKRRIPIDGRIKVKLTSAEPESALKAIIGSGIEILELGAQENLSCHFQIRKNSIRKLHKIAEKRGDRLEVIQKSGMIWNLEAFSRRPVLLAGCIILVILLSYLPTRVLFLQVSGNVSVPTKKILAAAETCGIYFGASRRDVRSEKMKNALLSEVPELQWAGINTFGCTAVISVRERAEQNMEAEEKIVSRIVADRDGYILAGTAVKGNALFRAGQTVTEGQVLISGYTDSGLSIQATRAEGEIFAQTVRQLEAVLPSGFSQRDAEVAQRKKYSLLIRKKRINLWEDSGISDSSCGRMYKEYYITLPGGFRLPAALCVDTYTMYESTTESLSENRAQEELLWFADEYLRQQMIAGEIRNRIQVVTEEGAVYQLQGSYLCVEMIGREQREQIGDTNGKTDGKIR